MDSEDNGGSACGSSGSIAFGYRLCEGDSGICGGGSRTGGCAAGFTAADTRGGLCGRRICQKCVYKRVDTRRAGGRQTHCSHDADRQDSAAFLWYQQCQDFV